MNDARDLVSALVTASPEAAGGYWHRWRRSKDIRQLSWQAVQLLPLLDRDQWRTWCADDPDVLLMRGIARRAWTEAQLHLATLRRTTALLLDRGVGPALPAGPCAVFLQNSRADSVRPLQEIHLLIPRVQLGTALRVLGEDSWTRQGPPVEGLALDWVTHVPLVRDGLKLKLFWRHLGVAPWRARQCEAEFFAKAGHAMPTEHLLLSLLAPGASDDGLIPWLVDAALLDLSEEQWERWNQLARRWAPSAFARAAALRRAGARVPFMSAPFWSRARLEEQAHRMLRALVVAVRRGRNRLAAGQTRTMVQPLVP